MILSFPWGAYLGEDSQTQGHHGEDLELGARRSERHPARRQGDGDLPQLDAGDDGGAPRRLRRGDHALARRLHRRRPGREHLRRQGRRPVHAAARRCRSCPGSRGTRSSDRAGPRIPCRGARSSSAPTSTSRTRCSWSARRPRSLRVRAVDDHEIGVGPVTRELQKAYLATVNGIDERWSHWLDVVEMTPSAA